MEPGSAYGPRLALGPPSVASVTVRRSLRVSRAGPGGPVQYRAAHLPTSSAAWQLHFPPAAALRTLARTSRKEAQRGVARGCLSEASEHDMIEGSKGPRGQCPPGPHLGRLVGGCVIPTPGPGRPGGDDAVAGLRGLCASDEGRPIGDSESIWKPIGGCESGLLAQ